MHDFLMPMSDYLFNLRGGYSEKINIILRTARSNIFALQHHMGSKLTKDDYLGSFKEFAEEFLNIDINYVRDKDFGKYSVGNQVSLSAYTFGPYNSITFERMIERAERLYNLEARFPDVVLIERGYRPVVADSMNNTWNLTGSASRFIKNHDSLVEVLRKKYGSRLINAKLEDMSHEDQINLFANASVVIGQHGAGLCNIAWTRNPSSVVIELPPSRFDTFRHMCLAKKFDYRLIYENYNKSAPSGSSVNISSLLDILPNS